MASYNKVILEGNVTRDVNVKYTAGGTAVAEVGMAMSHKWFDKQSNQQREETTFVDVTLFGRTAEIAGEFLAKGRPVLIDGRLKLDSWDDKTTGQKRQKLTVIGETLVLLGGGPARAPSGDSENQSPPNDNYGEEPQVPIAAGVPEDVPF